VVADSDAAAVPRQRVLKTKVADQAQDILTHVTGSVTHYARGTLIPGYMIGGKTGTAQIWDTSIGKGGDWKDNRFNHSFIGFVGANRPEVIIAVRIEEAVPVTTKPYLDLEIESYELFQMIARGAIKHLDIKRSRDPQAGLPILGTEAAKELTPERALQAKRQARREDQAMGVDRADARDTAGGHRPDPRARSRDASQGRREAGSRDTRGEAATRGRAAARDAGARDAGTRNAGTKDARERKAEANGAGPAKAGPTDPGAREAGPPADSDA
jgi:membrane peptidoglycan carboxypeptidase